MIKKWGYTRAQLRMPDITERLVTERLVTVEDITDGKT
jgi:hypothetical protein